MKYRRLGKTEFEISEISLGTWQLGGVWGMDFDFDSAEKVLETAVENGVNFFDTADIYNDGNSELAIGKFLKKHRDRIYVATKAGRGLDPHVAAGYTPQNIEKFVDDSLKRMQLDCLDLVQLHCPPTEVYYKPELFFALDKMKEKGKIRNYGVSVEKVEEAIKAMEYPGLATIQVIFNMFRQRPAEMLFDMAKKKDIGIIVRVPLASGLLTGKFSKDSAFNPNDHRFYNRDGSAFDKGETFAGVDYDRGLEAVEALKKAFPDRPLAEAALKYILMFDQVSCVIPGASKASQIERNIKTEDAKPLTKEEMDIVKKIYEEYIKNPVHYLW